MAFGNPPLGASLSSADLFSGIAHDIGRLAGNDLLATKAMRHVTARTIWPNSVSTTVTQLGFRHWNYSFVPVTTLRIWFYRGYVNTSVETGGGGSATYRAAVEFPRGTFTPLYSVSIADNNIGYVDIPVSIPAMTPFRIGGDINCDAGYVTYANWVSCCDTTNGDEFAFGASTGYGHVTDGTYMGSGFNVVVGPVLVQAMSDAPVYCALGDSIFAGTNDITFDPNGGHGMAGRALCSVGPNIVVATPGDKASAFVTPANSANRRQIISQSGATRGLLEFGTNDFYADGKTVANVESYRQTIRNMFPGLGWIDFTLPPRTNSTDSFATVANQTFQNSTYEGYRTNFNSRLRNGIAMTQGSLGTIDTAALVETNQTAPGLIPVINGGYWIPGYACGSDGTHPSSRCLDMLAPMIARALLIRRS